MATNYDPKTYHRLFGAKRTRAVYYAKDFADYMLMLVGTVGVLALVYGPRNPVAFVGYALCAFMAVSFVLRHGVAAAVPLIVRRPQDVLYMLVYKLMNVKGPYLAAVAVLAIEFAFVAMTPNLPHFSEQMRTVGIYLFFLHLIGVTVYRTAILVSHLRKRELIREVLMQTAWRKVVHEKTNVAFEVFHAYFTGVLTHIVLVGPWYFIITHTKYSLLFLPVALVMNFLVHRRWLRKFNEWFYRDHWLGDNAEIEFVYLHGPHHDAIPSGLIGVSGNGYLEGFLRHTLGAPTPFYNPAFSAMMYTIDVKIDIDLHQYIPGIFPKISRDFMRTIQHSTHHYGRLEPYGFGMKLNLPGVTDEYKRQFSSYPDEVVNSIEIDEALTGFKWDNPTQEQTLKLYDKYQP